MPYLIFDGTCLTLIAPPCDLNEMHKLIKHQSTLAQEEAIQLAASLMADCDKQ